MSGEGFRDATTSRRPNLHRSRAGRLPEIQVLRALGPAGPLHLRAELVALALHYCQAKSHRILVPL